LKKDQMIKTEIKLLKLKLKLTY